MTDREAIIQILWLLRDMPMETAETAQARAKSIFDRYTEGHDEQTD